MQRKLILSLLLFFTPIVAGCILAELLARAVPESYQFNAKQLEENKDSIEVLILGSSQMLNAVNADLLDRPAINMASGDQHHDTDLKIAKALVERLPKLNTVVFEVSYSHFEMPFNGPNFWKNNVYLSYYKINNFERPTYFKDHSLYLAQRRLYSEKINAYFFKNKPISGFNRFGFDTLNYSGSFQKLKYNKEAIANRNIKISTEENLYTFNKNTAHLFAMLRYFEANNIQVIICKTPMYTSYLRKRNPNILHRRDSVLAQTMINFPKIKVLDHEEDTTVYSVRDYINQSHLNPTGAIKFTEALSNLIEQ